MVLNWFNRPSDLNHGKRTSDSIFVIAIGFYYLDIRRV